LACNKNLKAKAWVNGTNKKLLQLSHCRSFRYVGAAKADRRLCVRFRGPPQSSYQVQVIWPPADDEQVLVVSECDAAACHEAGGPATAVAVTVTLADGRKP
jgi:hypothetical protein